MLVCKIKILKDKFHKMALFRLNDHRHLKRKQVWWGTIFATTNRGILKLASHTIVNYLHSSTKTRHLKDSTFKHRFYGRIGMIPTDATRHLGGNRDGRIELTERNNAFHNQFWCTKSSGGKFSRSSRFVTWTINSVVPMMMISPSRNRRGIWASTSTLWWNSGQSEEETNELTKNMRHNRVFKILLESNILRISKMTRWSILIEIGHRAKR